MRSSVKYAPPFIQSASNPFRVIGCHVITAMLATGNRMKNAFISSKYQQAIFDFVTSALAIGKRFFLLVRAVAGSGKTTTLVELLSRVPGTLRVIVLAFGKAIADEVNDRTPANVEGATFHRVGLRVCRKRLGRFIQIQDGKGKIKKTTYILWDRWEKIEGKPHPEYIKYSRLVTRLVDLAKAEGIGTILQADTVEAWQAIIDHHDLQLDHKEATFDKAIEIAREVLTESNKRALRGKIDFADQLYLPILLDLPFDQYDLVLVDEYQDTNQVRKEFVKRLLKPTGSVLAVGDDNQAIMGFTGADARATEDFEKDFPGATFLPLSISYRISKAVARLAQSIVSHIEASEDAPEGKVETLASYNVATFRPSDAVLCRNVAPLVTMAYSFIVKGVGCKILGRDIGEGLVALIKKLEPEGINHLLDKLTEYQVREIEKATKRSDAGKAESISDQCDCIRIIIDTLTESERDLSGLANKINSLFSDDKSKSVLTLCTIHKAKGLEWERVFILDVHRIPSQYATQEWQLAQETNLLFVAYTRSKWNRTTREGGETYFITCGNWQGERLTIAPKPTKQATDEPRAIATVSSKRPRETELGYARRVADTCSPVPANASEGWDTNAMD